MKRFLTGIVAASMMFAAFAAPAIAAEKSGKAAKKGWPREVTMGLIPTEGGADIVDRFKPLTEHLEKSLGVRVKAISASDYAGVITAMTSKHVDFAYFGPKSYVEAVEKAGAEALAMELDKEGNPGYYGMIIVRKDSPVKNIEAAKGRTFAFTDPNSTSGYLVPNILFYRDMKVKPEEYFKEVKFSGSHGASILAVKNGSIEVAATNNVDLARVIEKGQAAKDDFDTVWKSEVIPGSPIAARKDLPPDFKEALAKAVLDFNSNSAGVEKLQNGGFKAAKDSDYDVIRYLNRLKKELGNK